MKRSVLKRLVKEIINQLPEEILPFKHPSGKDTSMSPRDDDYDINYGSQETKNKIAKRMGVDEGKVICSTCNRVVGEKPDVPGQRWNVSHTWCDDCVKKMQSAMEKEPEMALEPAMAEQSGYQHGIDTGVPVKSTRDPLTDPLLTQRI
jgi:hypothetical protein